MFLKKTWKQPRINHIFSHRVNFIWHIIEGNTITALKSRIDAIIKPQPPSKTKKKIPEFIETPNFLCKYVYKMQLCLGPFYNILRQQNSFVWTIEHQKWFEEIKTLLTEQISNTIPDPDQPFYAMRDASNSRLFRQVELRLSTLMKKCTATKTTLTKYEFLIKCYLKKTWKQPG